MADLAGERSRILILGGGFGGAYCAKELAHRRNPGSSDALLLDRNNYVLFYPLLVEAGVGSIEARHVVVPIRKFTGSPKKRASVDFEMADVDGVDLKSQVVTYTVKGNPQARKSHFDHLVLALGSITREPDIPGLKEHGFQLKTLTDAIGLRDRGIRLLELANTISDSETRRELLSSIVVGANFTGVEFAGEYFEFLREAARGYRNVRESEVRMFLLEYSDKILSATTPNLARWCGDTLKKRGVEIRTNCTLKEVSPTDALTTHDDRIRTRTVLWAAGIGPNPLIKQIDGLPLNKHGYIDCDRDLKVKGFQNVWAIGDCSTVYSPEGQPYAATAQTASREGPLVARNILQTIAGRPTESFRYHELGSFAAIGGKQAAASVLGMSFTGFFGWLLYRGTYWAKMPTAGMKSRLLADWMTELVFRNEPVQLGVHRFKSENLS